MVLKSTEDESNVIALGEKWDEMPRYKPIYMDEGLMTSRHIQMPAVAQNMLYHLPYTNDRHKTK
jgi:hypothetical protein